MPPPPAPTPTSRRCASVSSSSTGPSGTNLQLRTSVPTTSVARPWRDATSCWSPPGPTWSPTCTGRSSRSAATWSRPTASAHFRGSWPSTACRRTRELATQVGPASPGRWPTSAGRQRRLGGRLPRPGHQDRLARPDQLRRPARRLRRRPPPASSTAGSTCSSSRRSRTCCRPRQPLSGAGGPWPTPVAGSRCRSRSPSRRRARMLLGTEIGAALTDARGPAPRRHRPQLRHRARRR